MRRRELVFGSALSAVGATLPPAAGAQPSDRSLQVGLASAFTSIDPHYSHAVPNHTVAMHLFDRLIDRSPEGKLTPGLATGWRTVSDTVWEFDLRPGVRFTDGGAFTADDVAFTVERAGNVPNSPSSLAGYLRPIRRVEVVGPLTLRLHTQAPAPEIPTNLTYIHIVSRRVGEGATTADYNGGKAAVGTGPFRFVSYVPGASVELARNDAWWGAKPAWSRITIRQVTNAASRSAALLSGDLDIIESPSVSDMPRLQSDERTAVSSIPGIRLLYLVPDLSRAGENPLVTDLNGKPLGSNPFRDGRVRQALSLAVPRDALAERIMLGTATPSGQWMPDGAYSYARSLPPPRQDLQAARRLLAEAGLGGGFKLVLHAPNDRYPGDSQLAQAVAQAWTRIGVQTALEVLPWSTYLARGQRQEFAMGLWGWGSSSFEGGTMLVNCLASYDRERGTGINNYGRYANPQLDGLVTTAMSTVDPAERERILVQATELAMKDTPIIPLLMLQNLWAHKRSLRFHPRADERTLAQDVFPA